MRTHSVMLVVAFAIGFGCNAASRAQGSDTFSSRESTSPAAPAWAPKADVIVKPDLLEVPFSVQAKAQNSGKGVEALQSEVERVRRAIETATGLAGTVHMGGLAANRAYKWEGDTRWFGNDGVVEFALKPDLDFWAKTRIGFELSRLRDEQAKQEGPTRTTIHPERFRVKDPETHRAELTAKWLARSRAFAEAVQSPSAPLVPTDCASPGLVEQETLSVDEVALKLAIACKWNASGVK